jgi:hypothetical protein
MLSVGAFVEGELYLHGCIFSKPVLAFILFLALFFYLFFLLLFLFFIQGLTRGHCLGMVTKVDSVTHKYFHKDEKVGRDETSFPLAMQPRVTTLA